VQQHRPRNTIGYNQVGYNHSRHIKQCSACLVSCVPLPIEMRNVTTVRMTSKSAIARIGQIRVAWALRTATVYDAFKCVVKR